MLDLAFCLIIIISSIFAICLWVWLGLNVDQIQCHNLLWIKEEMLYMGAKTKFKTLWSFKYDVRLNQEICKKFSLINRKEN